MKLKHDHFFKLLLGKKENAVEFLQYLKSAESELGKIFRNVNLETLTRLPGEFADMQTYGYADLAFTAQVKGGGELCIGILMEHKSHKDDDVLNQLDKYRYFLMKRKFESVDYKGMPTVALIIYNGQEKWNPLEELFPNYSPELRPLLLPFKAEFIDVKNIPESICESFNPMLSLGIQTMRYIWDFKNFKPYFEKSREALQKVLPPEECLEFLQQIDLYFMKQLSTNYKEMFQMDFVKPPYKTIYDSILEEGLADGELSKAREMAKAMLKDNLPLERIAAYTSLSEKEIKALA